MEVALVCIAKNEDNYIQEWVDYHLKLGFDRIFIYENDWKCNLENQKLTKIPVQGVRKQIVVYNEFIHKFKNEFDWVAFLDVDEFLCLKKQTLIKEFLDDFKDEDAIGINWVLFGDNGLNKTENFNLIERFTKRESTPNQHIKSIVNPKKVNLMHVHNHSGKCVDTNRKRIDNTSFNPNGPIDVAQINHYFVKTKEEFIDKVNRGRADTGTYRDISDFDSHNKNEVEDLTAYNFYYK